MSTIYSHTQSISCSALQQWWQNQQHQHYDTIFLNPDLHPQPPPTLVIIITVVILMSLGRISSVLLLGKPVADTARDSWSIAVEKYGILVSVPIVSNDRCKSMFLRAGRHEFIPDIFLCAGHETGGQDSCQGDSGGPLQVEGKDGTTSWPASSPGASDVPRPTCPVFAQGYRNLFPGFWIPFCDNSDYLFFVLIHFEERWTAPAV
ncbi:serine protease [Culex quinquefasciatus]|uniref:Serine protease n=1 Tax=Culex quinquefasciatus TaxID=7176 RepID=B0WN79_CULQU|nr:serine protease [Culex quinquefasciatus]|eukprot:XP_001850163.1 serine protease [Culex quinquefasciatus]